MKIRPTKYNPGLRRAPVYKTPLICKIWFYIIQSFVICLQRDPSPGQQQYNGDTSKHLIEKRLTVILSIITYCWKIRGYCLTFDWFNSGQLLHSYVFISFSVKVIYIRENSQTRLWGLTVSFRNYCAVINALIRVTCHTAYREKKQAISRHRN